MMCMPDLNDFRHASDLLCTDPTCKWFDPVSSHYVHDHEQMEEIQSEELAVTR